MQLFRQLRHAAAAAAAAALALAAGSACSNSTSPADSPVATVVLSDSVVTLRIGDEAALTARATQVGGSDLVGRPVFWSARDTNVALVSQSGVISARSVGTTQVAASVEGRTAVARVDVVARPITAVRIEPTSLQLVVGSRQRLTARALNDAGAPVATAITWTSETPAVVSVSADGEVTALASGAGSVRAAAGSVAATAAVVVSAVPVARVAVAPATSSITVGATQQLTATATDAAGATITGRVVAWSSRDPGVAVVSSTGQVTGIAPGSATIVAAIDGQSATATVTVRAVPVAAVRVTPDNTSVGVGGTVRLGAVVTDAAGNTLAGRAVSFASNNSGVARVADDGTVTGVSAGTATITATSEGVNGTATVRVTATPPATVAVASVRVTPGAASVPASASVQLAAEPRDANGNVLSGRAVAWSSSDQNVATVTSDGRVIGVNPGNATVRATSEGVTGSATITVTATVRVSPSAVSVRDRGNTNRTAQLVATDHNGRVLSSTEVTWSSSNTGIASVSTNGLVRGESSGSGTATATITVTYRGATATATVTVTRD
jgi:uncharacterized protein YjdB